MQQYKTMGYSALLLLILCLSSSDGFLENNRRQLQERNTRLNKNEQLTDRNFFGNTWQRSSEVKQERRIVPDRNVRLLPIGDSQRQIRDSRLFSAADSRRELDDRRLINHREQRKSSPLDNWDENKRSVITEENSRSTFDNSRRQYQDQRRISTAREQRQYSNFRVQERRNLATRENDRKLRLSDNSRRESSVERREIRSFSLARSRDQDRQISTDYRRSQSSDVSRRNIREREDNSRRVHSETRDRSRENSSREVRENRRHETGRMSVNRENERQIDNSRKQNRRIDTSRREIQSFVDRSIKDNSRRVRDSRDDSSRRVSADRDNSRHLEDSRRQTREFRRVILEDNRESQRMALERREIRLSGDNSRKNREHQNIRYRTPDYSLRLVEKRNRESLHKLESDNSRRQIRQFDQEIRILDRRLTKELDRNSRAASLRREISTHGRDSRLNSDATRRIALLNLSSKDENNNGRRFNSFEAHRYFARSERDSRQSRIGERRMATSFIPTENIEYIPEMKSNLLLNAAKVVLISFLIAQIVTNSSKTKRNWFYNLTNFVTVTKEKVL